MLEIPSLLKWLMYNYLEVTVLICKYSNSFAVHKRITARPEFLRILVSAEATDLIPPALIPYAFICPLGI